MASEVSICNVALTRLGVDEITALDDTDKASRLCNLHYAECRDALLRTGSWNWAVKRATLAALTNTPDWEWSYAFALPTDFLKLIATDFSPYADTPYRIESILDDADNPAKVIVTDASAVYIEYVAQITDPNIMDPLFRDALSARLAAELAVSFTQNAALAEKLSTIATDKLRLALTTHSQEGTAREHIYDAWVNARI